MLAAEIHQLQPEIWIWQAFDPSVKAELFSTALTTPAGLYLVDPIPLLEPQLRHVSNAAPIVGIIVTNSNHPRSATAYSERFSVAIFAHAHTFRDPKPARFTEVKNAVAIGDELEVIEIDGAVAGEIALYHPSNGGTLIVGDALINFEPYGFTLLPRKYCLNEKRMRSSLRQLLTRPAERMLFAHGTPIPSRASVRLRQLLESDS